MDKGRYAYQPTKASSQSAVLYPLNQAMFSPSPSRFWVMMNSTSRSQVICPDLRMLYQRVIPDQRTRSMKRAPFVVGF